MPGIYDTETWRMLDPRLQMAFMAMSAAAPGNVGITSGWRSNETQRRLHAQKPNLAAAPGKSNHEFGLAIDMTFENAATRRWVHANAARYGLWFPMDYEPWHIQLIGVDRHNISGLGNRGGGRDAFSQPPDRRFVNPYDAMGGLMALEDNTDPITQFERVISAISSGGGLAETLASPSTGLESPTTAVGSSPVGSATGSVDNQFEPARPGDTEVPL